MGLGLVGLVGGTRMGLGGDEQIGYASSVGTISLCCGC